MGLDIKQVPALFFLKIHTYKHHLIVKDRGAWHAVVHVVTKGETQLSN